MHMYKEMGKNRYEKLRIKTEEKKAYFYSMKMDVPSVSQETTNVDYNVNVRRPSKDLCKGIKVKIHNQPIYQKIGQLTVSQIIPQL